AFAQRLAPGERLDLGAGVVDLERLDASDLEARAFLDLNRDVDVTPIGRELDARLADLDQQIAEVVEVSLQPVDVLVDHLLAVAVARAEERQEARFARLHHAAQLRIRQFLVADEAQASDCDLFALVDHETYGDLVVR